MDSNRSCVNQGGTASLVSLDDVPQLEAETVLSDSALRALACWQARAGEVFTLIDPEMTAYRARITSLEPGRATCVPFAIMSANPECSLRIEVYQALPEKERFELVLQKLTEIGVNCIVPLESSRSITLHERDLLQKKSHRWPDVVNRAARQCRRAMLPELMPVHSFTEALQAAASAELKLMLYEKDTAWTFQESFASLRPASVALLVGPEGGFSEAEVEQARAEGFLPVSLGPRILRTETAAIVAATLVQGLLGDLK